MWEQMNGGTSNKTLKAFFNSPSSTVNKTSSQMSNVRIFSLFIFSGVTFKISWLFKFQS